MVMLYDLFKRLSDIFGVKWKRYKKRGQRKKEKEQRINVYKDWKKLEKFILLKSMSIR